MLLTDLTKPDVIRTLSKIAFSSGMYTKSTINDWTHYFHFLMGKGMVEVEFLPGNDDMIVGFLTGYRSNKYRSHIMDEVPPLPTDPTVGKFLYVVCAWVYPPLRGSGVIRAMFKNAMKRYKGVQFIVWNNQKRKERRFIGKWVEAERR